MADFKQRTEMNRINQGSCEAVLIIDGNFRLSLYITP